MQIPMSLPRQLATRIEGIPKVKKQVTQNRGISERRKQNIRRQKRLSGLKLISRHLPKLILQKRKLERNYMQTPKSWPRQPATRTEKIPKVKQQVTQNREILEKRKQKIQRQKRFIGLKLMSRHLPKLILRKRKPERNYMQMPKSQPRQPATRVEEIPKVKQQVKQNRVIARRLSLSLWSFRNPRKNCLRQAKPSHIFK